GFKFAHSLCLDSNGNVYVVGWYYGNASMNGTVMTSIGNYDAFVVKLNSAGTFQYVKSFGGGGYDFPNGVVAGPGGSIYISGVYQYAIGFGSVNLAGNSGYSSFLVKMNASGTFQNAWQI